MQKNWLKRQVEVEVEEENKNLKEVEVVVIQKDRVNLIQKDRMNSKADLEMNLISPTQCWKADSLSDIGEVMVNRLLDMVMGHLLEQN